VKLRATITLIAAFMTSCGTTYPVSIVEDTQDLLVISATGKTQDDALNAAEEKAVEEVGVYITQKGPDCTYHPGGGQEISGHFYKTESWYECVIYAQKPK
jgi:hypothetical protein